ncbi:MAG: hypothetical protein KDB22_16535, partial [Planctomycetales bacterium]|nr:hypothetical protein [Planctomycetales bacterium]
MAPADRPIAPALLEVFDCSPSDGSYYLDELLERLEMQSPGHPLVAVFQPLMQADLTILEHEAGRYYNEIAQGVIDDRQRFRLQEVFMDWLLQRFSDRGAKEIEKMLVG